MEQSAIPDPDSLRNGTPPPDTGTDEGTSNSGEVISDDPAQPEPIETRTRAQLSLSPPAPPALKQRKNGRRGRNRDRARGYFRA